MKPDSQPCSFSEPHTEYTRRLAARRAEVARLARLSEQVSLGRLASVALAAGVWWFGVRPGLIGQLWVWLPVVVFFTLIFFHERVRRRQRLATRAVRFYEHGVERLEDRWAGAGEQGEQFADDKHPYALDLDLFGRGSLFELLCRARTRGGEQMLADWLRAPAAPEEIHARQAAVAELRNNLDLREELALKGEDIRVGVHPEMLVAWAQTSPRISALGRLRVTAALLAVANVATLAWWVNDGAKLFPFVAAIVVSGWFSWRLRASMLAIIGEIAQASRDLRLLAEILTCFEQERFICEKLAKLRSDLETQGVLPSRHIARLGRLINLLESQNNQLFLPFAALLVWAPQVTLAIEAWRQAVGPAVARWLAALSEGESLCSLASYAYEHPVDPFPEIVTNEVCLHGEELGHPLLPDARCVQNTVCLQAPLQTLIVSGSNMSGKSTLLRTVGINAVLAFTGAPVRARHLRIAPLVIGATLRIQDSLQEGSSRFYAEIMRLSTLMHLAKGPLPVLFLLDEILHGTNSHDRQIGAEAIIRGFLKLGAIGLVTTHDLALARVAEALTPRAANVCFEDHFENGQLVFDYRMRPGIVQKSNALALMRSVGLEV